MAFDLASISNAKRTIAPRVILLGEHGVGKSEMAAGADTPIFCPIIRETGIDALDVEAFPVITKYDELTEAITTMANDEHKFKTFVIDSTSTFEPLVHAKALDREGVKTFEKLGGGYGRQWDTIRDLWRDICDGLDVLRSKKNMTIILTGHVEIRAARTPEVESYDQWIWDIDKKVAGDLSRWADAILFMGRKYNVKKKEGGFGKDEKLGIENIEGQRYLWSDATATRPGKRRGYFNKLPSELKLPRIGAWSTLLEAINTEE